MNSELVLLELRRNAVGPAAILTLSPGAGDGSLMRLLHSVFTEASTKLTVAGMTGAVAGAAGEIATAVTCTPTVPVTAPVNSVSEATVKELPLLVPMLALPFAEKKLDLAMVTDAPGSVELNTVVAAATVRLRLLPAWPSTVLPLDVRVPRTVTSEVAVVTAFTVKLWAPTAAPTTALPFSAVLPATVRP